MNEPRGQAFNAAALSGVKYVKGNFLPTRTFRDLADLNAQARRWVMEEAGTRVHGTTREQPLVLFEAERPLLRRLPPIAPDLGTWHRVVLHRDCHVQHDKSLYLTPDSTIPFFCGSCGGHASILKP